ncbi:hypothetical protein CHISP_2435 [Chitinispirillum alkaliphilum]|nr:hypothetical protein CHISP_2435 [Chitinispirillum alkaliphilum]
MNIKFEYLYRDGANYKNWGEVIFSNSGNMPVDQINARIEAQLIDRQNFLVSRLKVPDLYFEKTDPSLDHGWHEFYGCSETGEEVSDLYRRDISDVIDALG